MGFSEKVGRSAVWAVAGQAVTALLSVVSFAVVGRFVEPSAYGAFLLAMTVLAATQWLAQNAYREPLIQATDLSDDQINTVFTFSAVVGVLLCTGMIIAAAYFSCVQHAPTIAACVFVLALKLLFDSMSSVPLALRIRSLDFKFIAKISVATNLLATTITMCMLAVGMGAVALALSQLTSAALTLAILLYTGQRAYRLRIKRADLALLQGYSLHVILWQALEATGQTVDRYLIATRLSLIDLGLYGFGKRLNDVIVDVLVGATSSVALPAFSQLQTENERLRTAFLKAVRTMLLLVLPVLASLAVTAEDFVPLVFGVKWVGATNVYRSFLLLGVVQSVGILQGGLLRSRGRPGVWTRYQLAQCITNVIVISLVASYGIEWLAASIVIRTYLLWGWVVWQTCIVLNMKFTGYLLVLLKPLAIGVATIFFGFWLHSCLQDLNVILRLLISGIFVYVIFGVLASIFLHSDVWESIALARRIVSKRPA